MKLGTEVDLGPGHIVLDGDPARPLPLPLKRGTGSQFSAHVHCGMPLGVEVGLGPGDVVLDVAQLTPKNK